MTKTGTRPRLKYVLAADLFSNVKRRGLVALMSAAVYDPSFSTVLYYRIAARLYTTGFRRIGKLLWRLNVMLSGCHIHLEAEIGPGLKLPHPTGIIVGQGARLGCNVTLYQNVTIGSGHRDGCYPNISDGCIIYPNAVVVGNVTLGARAVIGANAVVICDIPAGSVAAGNPAKILRSDHSAGN